MNFKLDDDTIDQIIGIFACIKKKLKIDLDNYWYEDKSDEEYLKIIVSNETCFRRDKDKELIKFQMKILSIIVEYYYKYNLFIIV